jgi:peptide/nickel transport system substrate-binding protein
MKLLTSIETIVKTFAAGLILIFVATASWAGEMVDVKLTKLDGTTMIKKMEKPRYGGWADENPRPETPGWSPDGPMFQNWPLQVTLDRLLSFDFYRGPTGTDEYSFIGGAPPNVALIGNVAESWEQTDLTTIILKIRRGVRHWDKSDVARPHKLLESAYGRELDAYDIEYSWNRIVAAPTSGQTGRQEKYKALDKWTLEISWEKPDGTLMPANLSGTVLIRPVEVTNEVNSADWQNAIGTGPFIPIGYVEGSVATYKRNPNYWQRDPFFPENQLPYLDGFRQIVLKEDEAIIAALRTGKLERAPGLAGINWRHAESLAKSNPELKHAVFYSSMRVMHVRVDLEDSPWQDIRVRQAAMLAVPHQQVVDGFYKGNAGLYGWPACPGHAPLYVPYEELPTEPTLPESGASAKELIEYHPDKARQLLAEAGYPDGFEFELLTPPEFQEWAQLYAGFFDAVGLHAKIRVEESGVYSSMLVKGEAMGMAANDWGGCGNALLPFNYYYQPGHQYNYSHVTMEQGLDVVLDKYADIAETLDPKEFIRKFRELLIYTIEKAHVIGLPPESVLLYWQPWLKGFSGEGSVDTESAHSIVKHFWIDQDLQRETTGSNE